jgi:hypothetical protein
MWAGALFFIVPSPFSLILSAASQEQIDLHFVYRYNQIAWGKQGWVRQS